MRRTSCGAKQKLRKGLWSPEEDEKLYNYIKRFGVGCWSSVPKLAGLQRCGKSCRLRWINYLRPDLKRGMFSQEEEHLIISLHEALGNRWAQIATQLPGRTDNEIKNFWNSSLKKKLMKQGIDPNTHKPMAGVPPPARDDHKDCAHINNALHILHPNGLANFSTSIPMGFHSRENLASKQALDPLFIPDHFQASVDPDGFQSDFQNLVSPFDQNQMDHQCNPPIDPICGFNSMPKLTSFDHHNMIDADYSDNTPASRMSSLDIIHAGIQANSNMMESGGAFAWDVDSKSSDSMFPFQFGGIEEAEERKINPWQEGHPPHHTQSSGVYGNYQVITSPSLQLNGVNLDVFQQL